MTTNDTYTLSYNTIGTPSLNDPDDWCSGECWHIPISVCETDEDGLEDEIDRFDFIPEDWLTDWDAELDELLAKEGWRRVEDWPEYGENVEVKVERVA